MDLHISLPLRGNLDGLGHRVRECHPRCRPIGYRPVIKADDSPPQCALRSSAGGRNEASKMSSALGLALKVYTNPI